MKHDDWTIEYWVRGGKPKAPSNPDYPHGIAADVRDGEGEWCVVNLPYPNPNKNIGTWIAVCGRCGMRVGVTAASRPDDPHTVLVSCKEKRDEVRTVQ